MLCARVRVIVRACDPMGPHGAVWGAVWALWQRCGPWPLSEGPRRTSKGPQPCSRRNPTPMASQGLSGPLRGAQ